MGGWVESDRSVGILPSGVRVVEVEQEGAEALSVE